MSSRIKPIMTTGIFLKLYLNQSVILLALIWAVGLCDTALTFLSLERNVTLMQYSPSPEVLLHWIQSTIVDLITVFKKALQHF